MKTLNNYINEVLVKHNLKHNDTEDKHNIKFAQFIGWLIGETDIDKVINLTPPDLNHYNLIKPFDKYTNDPIAIIDSIEYNKDELIEITAVKLVDNRFEIRIQFKYDNEIDIVFISHKNPYIGGKNNIFNYINKYLS